MTVCSRTYFERVDVVAWDKNHKQQTRLKIVASAAELFTRKGFDAVAINDVMALAGLTRGAFYAHFKSKSELYSESILNAAHAAKKNITALIPKDPDITDIAMHYLSLAHAEGDTHQCPLAFLTTDIQQRDHTVRAVYRQVFESFVADIEKLSTGSNASGLPATQFQASALQSAVLMIGGLALTRALDDKALQVQLLQACQQGVAKLQP